MKFRDRLTNLLSSGSTDQRRPELRKNNESNVKGLYIIGDLAGAPVIKLAMAQAVDLIDHLAGMPGMRNPEKPDCLDLLIVGAGAAGLNAALAAKDQGLTAKVLEKGKIANTIENFPEGKWVYAEPDSTPAKGKLWLDGARKEDLVKRWNAIVRDNRLDVQTEEPLTGLNRRKDGTFEAQTPEGTYRAHKIVLATGQRGNPRQLGVPGEEQEHVYHRLYSPTKYRDEDILVVGGGNSAVEAALTLSKRNRVLLSYRGGEFTRLFKDNQQQLDQALAEGRIEVLLNSTVNRFGADDATLEVDRGGHREEVTVPAHHAFCLIGADLPVRFLKSLGIRLENEWVGSPWWSLLLSAATLTGLSFLGGRLGGSMPIELDPAGIAPLAGGLVAIAAAAGIVWSGVRGDRWSWLGLSFLVWYSIYGIKVGAGSEFWPFRGWGYESLSFFSRPWAFWYTVMYTGLMTVFGIGALKRWGIDRKDKFQIWRYTSLLAFQWIFFFLIPEFLFQWAIKYQWVGEALANDPQFAEQAWRSYGIVYAWPLFIYTWFYDPHQIWVIWGVLLTFALIPLFVLFHGKRYCSWICGCGGLAETFGDRWRHLAPKGRQAEKLEWMGLVVLVFATLVTLALLAKDTYGLIKTADWSIYLYRILVDVWLVGILPVTVYPFMGGKVWCRYWCPLAKMMQIFSKGFTLLGLSRFHIVANDKCIACNECSRNCQVGIDVMQYALKQETLDNGTSSCIGCGVCVSVCPMDTLSFDNAGGQTAAGS
ncbi:MAG: NAD(P)-binding domain-containing protein [Acidobacteriota bacterium]|nr:NAD(P)-binding domain-containing protein [Acidobacteriota bacterium]